MAFISTVLLVTAAAITLWAYGKKRSKASDTPIEECSDIYLAKLVSQHGYSGSPTRLQRYSQQKQRRHAIMHLAAPLDYIPHR